MSAVVCCLSYWSPYSPAQVEKVFFAQHDLPSAQAVVAGVYPSPPPMRALRLIAKRVFSIPTTVSSVFIELYQITLWRFWRVFPIFRQQGRHKTGPKDVGATYQHPMHLV